MILVTNLRMVSSHDKQITKTFKTLLTAVIINTLIVSEKYQRRFVRRLSRNFFFQKNLVRAALFLETRCSTTKRFRFFSCRS